MADYNHCVLLGRLTRDVETKYLPSGTAIADMSLAVGKTWNDNSGQKKERTSFFDVTAFGRTAEVAGEYLRKGAQVLISGELVQETWDDKQTGQKRSKVKVHCNELKMLGGKGGAPRGEESQVPEGDAEVPW